MFATTKGLWITLSLLIAAIAGGCSGGPSGPATGTPEWYWQAAAENFGNGDLAKTEEHLSNLVKSESEWQKRGAAWRLVVLSGLARGYLDLGDAYTDGAKNNEGKAEQFRNPIQQYQRYARQFAIALAESSGPFQKSIASDATVTLDFAFPGGSPNESAILTSVSGGTLPKEESRAEAEDAAVMRGVLLQTTLLSVSGDDVTKARAAFEAGAAEVPRQLFLAGLAKTLYATAELFDRLHLNQPDIGKILVQRSEECLELALDTEDEEIKQIAEAVKEEIANDTKEREKIGRR
jgi:hypothetical protein